jgi:hypothetical protein
VGGCKDPLWHDERAVAQAIVFQVDKRLPRPLSNHSIFATDDQCLDVVDYSSAFGCRQRINFRKINLCIYLEGATLNDALFGKSKVQLRLELLIKRIQLSLREFCWISQRRYGFVHVFCILLISGFDQQQGWL